MRALALIAVLSACSFPEKELVDGQGTPFGCINAPTPTTADSPAVISGVVIDPFTGTPVANAAVAGQLPGVMTSIFVAHSDAAGKFRQSQNTNGTPLDLYLTVSANGFKNTYYYPARKLTHDVTYQLSLLTQGDETTLAGAAQLTFDPTKGHMLMTINDCNDTPLAGATISTSPAGTIRYFNGVVPSTTATATDQQGVVMVANLPPGNVTLSATVGGMALKSHNLQVVADSYIQTQVQP